MDRRTDPDTAVPTEGRAAEEHTTEGRPTGAALEEAVRRGRAAEVARLVAAGADPEQPIGEYRETTPLCLAAASGHTAVVRVLLAAGVHPDARNGLGHLPLVLAATAGRAGHPAAVDLLLDAGADVEARTRGRTAPEWADGFGLTEPARRLRGRGARPAGAASPRASPQPG